MVSFSMAWKGHLSAQVPHLIHIFWSITCGLFISPSIAPTGQFLLQIPQPLQISGLIFKLHNALQYPALHLL